MPKDPLDDLISMLAPWLPDGASRAERKVLRDRLDRALSAYVEERLREALDGSRRSRRPRRATRGPARTRSAAEPVPAAGPGTPHLPTA